MLPILLLLAAQPDLAAEASRQVAQEECRLRDGEEAITVCGRRDRQKRFQVTDPNAPYDPRGNVPGAMTERMGWISEGDSGIGSCSAIGPSAGTGCLSKRGGARCSRRAGWCAKAGQ